MTYFVDEIIDFGIEATEDFSSDRAIFRDLNQNKEGKHSANKILRNASGEVIAVRCNCGKKVYHPATEGKVFWENYFSKKELRMFRSKSIRTEKLILATEFF